MRSTSRGLSPEKYQRVTLLALIALCAIIVTGAAVRLTGSGLGCSDWPNCEEDQFVASLEFHPLIEFVNRLITGVVSVAVIAAVLGSMRRTPRRSDLTRWSWGLVAGVIGQIILGAFVVKSELAPVTVIAHFFLSVVLVWNAVVLHYKAGQPDELVAENGAGVDSMERWAWGIAAWAVVVLFLGTLVTGSGPHSGAAVDQLGEVAERLPFDTVTITRIHSIGVWFLAAGTLAFLWRLKQQDPSKDVWSAANVVLAVMAGQGVIGYTQYFADVPALLVGFHVAGAVVFWIAVCRLVLVLRDPAPVAATPDERELVQ